MAGFGVGLIIHGLSYAGHLDFGFTALAELVGDPDRIARGVQRHIALLLAATQDHPAAAKPPRHLHPAKA